jgi:hypothetical protein
VNLPGGLDRECCAEKCAVFAGLPRRLALKPAPFQAPQRRAASQQHRE